MFKARAKSARFFSPAVSKVQWGLEEHVTAGLSLEIEVGVMLKSWAIDAASTLCYRALPACFYPISLCTLNDIFHDIQSSRLYPDCRRTRHDMPVPECASSEVKQAATSS